MSVAISGQECPDGVFDPLGMLGNEHLLYMTISWYMVNIVDRPHHRPLECCLNV
jgi:hypothetical protein